MEKYILVEYLSSLQAVITQTFKSTKRIKLTSFDISNNYIIFGASSGGLYIFKREPCEFVKLIPSKEGSALNIVIASNERDIAIGTSKGLLLVVQNFLDLNFRLSVVSYHENNVITEIKWHGNNVYSGDNTGRVSVFVLNHLVPIFNMSSSIIMQLESSIVQIDSYLNYLLISSHTRTYLCDTEKEQYKQIGKKLRDGYFGACFFNASNNVLLTDMTNLSFRGVFETVREDEMFAPNLINPSIKIYCARPGARIWEANFEATVLMTYQFRDSLAQPSSNIFHVADNIDAKLNISTSDDNEVVSSSLNFGKIYSISSRFLLSYDTNGIYFFHPKISRLGLWTNYFKNIKDVKILDSALYIWQESCQVKILLLDLLEDIIIKTLLNKQYTLCAELCVYFKEEIQPVLNCSDKIHLISILKHKLAEIGATDLLNKMIPILNILEEVIANNGIKGINGIVLENECNKEDSNYFDYMYTPVSVKNFDSSISNLSLKEIDNIGSLLNLSKNYTEQVDFQRNNKHQLSKESNVEDNRLLALYKQYQLNKTHKTAELTESSIILEELNLDEIFTLFNDFVRHTESIDKTDATLWCKEQFLKKASKKIFNISDLKQNTEQFLSESFLDLNVSTNYKCGCGFPLPKAHNHPVKYYKLGCKILDHSKDPNSYIKLIPYLYKYKLNKIHNINDLLLNLPLLTQFSDKNLFEQFSTKFTYDTWDEIVNLFIKLRQRVCLNCGQNVELDGLLSWTELGMVLVKSIGSKNAARLLKRYSTHIPNGELDMKFYQCCILSSVYGQPNSAVNFIETVVNNDTTEMFENLLGKFIQKKYLGHQSIITKCDENMEIPECTRCKLPLNDLLLNESNTCDCGHDFHNICLFSHDCVV